MPKIYVPSRSAEDWKIQLAQPELHWKPGYSAMSLAQAWEATAGDLPPQIRDALEASGDPALLGLTTLIGLPEYAIPLPGGSAASRTDLLIIARGSEGLVVIAVEGKVDETFGPTLGERRADASDGATRRIEYLLKALGLPQDTPGTVRYQLLHRAVSALLAAEQFNARDAVLLVHSFSSENRGFDDFQAFVALFGAKPGIGEVASLGEVGGRRLFAGWCRGDQRFRRDDGQ